MIPIIIVLLILIFSFLLSLFYGVDKVSDIKCGGSITSQEIEPIKNKEFFINDTNSEIIYNLLQFENKTLQYFSDIKDVIQRNNDTNLIRTTIHVGQLKLFLSELEFLTEFIHDYKHSGIIIYAGSAPSNKIYYLHTLYPNLKFLLIDPAEHFIMLEDGNHYDSKKSDIVVYLDTKNKENNNNVKRQLINLYDPVTQKVNRILKKHSKSVFLNYMKKDANRIKKWIQESKYTFYIIEDYFTNDIADFLSGLDCYFISDIRSNIHSMLPLLEKLNKRKLNKPLVESSEEMPSDLDICWNNAMHLNWLIRLQPKSAMLKFRTAWFGDDQEKNFEYYQNLSPYVEDFAEAKKNGIDFITDYKNKKMHYFQYNNIYIQSFPGKGSSESRLICTNYNKFQEIDLTDYDNKFYYYNWFYRQFAFVKHDCVDLRMGIDGCNDCALMVKIYQDYFIKYKLDYDANKIKNEIRKLLYIIKRTIRKELHGKFTKPYKNVQEIVKRQSIYILLSVYDEYEDALLNYKIDYKN